MDDLSFERERFRWDRQKFILILSVVVFAFTSAAATFYINIERDRQATIISAEIAQKSFELQRETSFSNKELEQQISRLQAELADMRSLVNSIRENQKAQENLLRELSKGAP